MSKSNKTMWWIGGGIAAATVGYFMFFSKEKITSREAFARFLETRNTWMPGSGNDLRGARSTRTGTDLYWYNGAMGIQNLGNDQAWANQMAEGFEKFKKLNPRLQIVG
jgi:hypothetical protein